MDVLNTRVLIFGILQLPVEYCRRDTTALHLVNAFMLSDLAVRSTKNASVRAQFVLQNAVLTFLYKPPKYINLFALVYFQITFSQRNKCDKLSVKLYCIFGLMYLITSRLINYILGINSSENIYNGY